MKFLLPLALLVPNWTYGNSFTVSNTLPDDLSSASNVFGKSVEVFGLRVLATSSVPDAKVLHTANVLAEYLDNDENGSVDQPEVLAKLLGNSNSEIATMVLFASENEQESYGDDFETLMRVLERTQNLFADEIFENGSQGDDRDATLEEVLHLVTDLGWDEAFPAVWGERKGSTLADAMDLAREATIKRFPSSTPTGHGSPTTTIPRTMPLKSPNTSTGQPPPTSADRTGPDASTPFTPTNGNPTPGRCSNRPIHGGGLLTSANYNFPTKNLPDGNYQVSAFRAQAESTALSGWKKSPWFGFFYDSGSNWIYHATLGWLYLHEVGDGSVWFHHSNFQWFWTNEQASFLGLLRQTFRLAILSLRQRLLRSRNGLLGPRSRVFRWKLPQTQAMTPPVLRPDTAMKKHRDGMEFHGRASVSLSHATSNGNSVMTLTSNLYPNWNLSDESDHYATTFGPERDR